MNDCTPNILPITSTGKHSGGMAFSFWMSRVDSLTFLFNPWVDGLELDVCFMMGFIMERTGCLESILFRDFGGELRD